MATCPACGETIKDGIFGANIALSKFKLALVNEYHPEKADERCEKCGNPLYEKYKLELLREREALVGQIQQELPAVPVVSLQAPLNWDYAVCGLVTGQSTTGTGVFAEFTSAFTDLFGSQSKSYNQKLKAGEEIVKSIVRKEALDVGANAVIAVDIDYAEVGGDKGMLMVCMTGTAVRLKNPEILGDSAVRSLASLRDLRSRLDHLFRYGLPT